MSVETLPDRPVTDWLFVRFEKRQHEDPGGECGTEIGGKAGGMYRANVVPRLREPWSCDEWIRIDGWPARRRLLLMWRFGLIATVLAAAVWLITYLCAGGIPDSEGFWWKNDMYIRLPVASPAWLDIPFIGIYVGVGALLGTYYKELSVFNHLALGLLLGVSLGIASISIVLFVRDPVNNWILTLLLITPIIIILDTGCFASIIIFTLVLSGMSYIEFQIGGTAGLLIVVGIFILLSLILTLDSYFTLVFAGSTVLGQGIGLGFIYGFPIVLPLMLFAGLIFSMMILFGRRVLKLPAKQDDECLSWFPPCD